MQVFTNNQLVRKGTGVFLTLCMLVTMLAALPAAMAAVPSVTGITMNETRTIVTINFGGSISAVSGVDVKTKIKLSRGGATPSSLPSGAAVRVNASSLVVSLTAPLTDASNYFVISAGALADQNEDITTANINAEGPKLASDGVTVDDTKKIVTLRFEQAFSGYPNDDALKNGYVSLARNGSSYSEVIPSNRITINGSAGELVIRLDTALSGSSSKFKISAGKIQNKTTGNINLEDIITPAISANFDKTPPELDLSRTNISSDNRTITLYFDENIYNVYATGISSSAAIEILKSHIWVDRGGAGYTVLGGQDTVSLGSNYITVRLSEALTGNNNTMKIDGGSLRDSAGNVQYNTLETGRLIASNGGSTTGAPLYSSSSISSNRKTITMYFDRQLQRASNLTSSQLKAKVGISRNSGSFTSLSSYDSVSISGSTLVIALNTALSGSYNRIRVLGGALASTSGVIQYDDVYSQYFNESSSSGGPEFYSISYSESSRQVKIRFDRAIYAVSSSRLKSGVRISRDSGSFTTLDSDDDVSIYSNDTLLINLDEPLTGRCRFRIEGGTLRSSNGVVQYDDQYTDYIDAEEEGRMTVSFSLSSDGRTATLTFSDYIYNNYPYDTNNVSLKQSISVSRNGGTTYSNLGTNDTILISGRTLRITFENALSSSDVIRISAYALKDRYGNALDYEIKTGKNYQNSSLFNPDTGVTLSSDRTTITLRFNERIYNNMSTNAALKNMIRIASDGVNYTSLSTYDSVSIGNTGVLIITLDVPISSDSARVKILAGALQDSNRDPIEYDIVTNALGASDQTLKVTLNGSVVNFTTNTTSRDGNNNVIHTVAVDSTSATSPIGGKGQGVSLAVTMPTTSYGGTLTMPGDILKLLQDKAGIITVECGGVAHLIPASLLNMNEIKNDLGLTDSTLRNATIEFTVSRVEGSYAADLTTAASSSGFIVVVPATEFTIQYKTASTTRAVTKFDQYIEKRFSISKNLSNSQYATVVRVETSGKVNHVPTKLETKASGDLFLTARTRQNGVYAVITASRSFTDTPSWAAPAVNSLASRQVLTAFTGTLLKPSQAATRAEVADVVTKGMGIYTDKSGASQFLDVTLTDTYYTATAVAAEYGLINGYGDNTFKPEQKISRQEAVAIIARTIRLAKNTSTAASSTLTSDQADELLAKFADRSAVADWAKIDMAECVQAGVIKGDNKKMLNPNDDVTRAELMQMVYNLLTEYGYIG